MTDIHTEPTDTAAEPALTTAAPPPAPPFRDLPPVTERELAARARGLASAYIDGGDDPDPDATKRQEAKYWRLLFLMIIVIVGSGLVFTVLDIASTGLGK